MFQGKAFRQWQEAFFCYIKAEPFACILNILKKNSFLINIEK